MWSTRLIINFSSCENIMKNGAFAFRKRSETVLYRSNIEFLVFARENTLFGPCHPPPYRQSATEFNRLPTKIDLSTTNPF